LVLTPTRELAIQIDESFKAYGRHVRLRSTVIFGGVGQGPQTTALQKGIDIVIATPGRLLDLMQQGYVDLRHVEIFVLDEADRMLDMGFVRDVEKILKALPSAIPKGAGKKRQSLFFSATMPPAIVKLAHEIVHDPVKVVVTPIASTVDLIGQSLYHVDKPHKAALLMDLLEDRDIKSALVFTRTKHGADTVVKVLTRNNFVAEAIHGNKAQNFRQRALANFKARKTRVLVATDIAARGIDIDDLEYVINYEVPNVPETYVHRIGRTGRAGAAGTAISFCSPEEKPFVKDIEKLIGKRIPVAHHHLSAAHAGPTNGLLHWSARAHVVEPHTSRPSGDHSPARTNRARPRAESAPHREVRHTKEPVRGHVGSHELKLKPRPAAKHGPKVEHNPRRRARPAAHAPKAHNEGPRAKRRWRSKER
jgi:ATP-dependent RNA helicase RhlE